MKKKLALVLAAAMVMSLALTGCGSKETPAASGNAPAASAPAAGEKLTITLATGSL